METMLLIVCYFFVLLGLILCCILWVIAGNALYEKLFGEYVDQRFDSFVIPKFKYIILGSIFCGPLIPITVICIAWRIYTPIVRQRCQTLYYALLQKLRDWHHK